MVLQKMLPSTHANIYPVSNPVYPYQWRFWLRLRILLSLVAGHEVPNFLRGR